MPKHFDLVVVGTGSAAGSIAYSCRAAGWSVAVVDSRPFGGTCANRGCDPKKVLVGAADLADWVRRMKGRGVAGDAHIDWPELMRFKHTFTDLVPANWERGVTSKGIAAYHGVARFAGAELLQVGDEELSASHFAIAAGAGPVPLGIPGEELLIDSDRFLDLETLPESLIFVGGGYIAFEFAHLALRAGARVTILHRGARPLEKFDAGLVDQLVEHSRRVGIDVRVGHAVDSITKLPGGVAVRTSDGNRFEAAVAVHAAGRAPQLDPLNLAAASVEAGPRGVKVNEFLQSVSNPKVYAAGDGADTGAPALTPVAGYEGRVAAANLLHGNRERANYDGVASTVFTIPPLAMTGMTDDAARLAGRDFEVKAGDSTTWYSSRRIAEECSGYKVLVEKGTGKVLGAHILGEGSDELINVFALAVRHGLTAEQMKGTLFAYPTHGSNVQYMVA
jgi:glutathione reductase (NADPH)